jgi:YopX protein
MANREIKFRAWNGIGMYLSGECTLWELGTWLQSHSDIHSENESLLMQYIGLKDKNGKEIYEGDILKFTGSNVKVVFDQGGFGYEFLIQEERMIIPFLGHSAFDAIMSRCEVIGNIYEHPELLN